MAWTQQKRPGRWTGYYRDHTGKARSAGTYDNQDRALAEARNKQALTTNTPEHAQDLTWGTWVEQWLPSRKLEASSRATYQDRIDKHLQPRWGNHPIADITHDETQAWVDRLDDYLAPSTVKVCFNILQSSLTDAVRRGFIPANPCQGVNLPAERVSPERFLTTDETDAIRGKLAADDWFTYDLLLATGMRWGELAGLHWDRVDFDNQTLKIDMQYDFRAKAFKPTKGKNTRWVPLPEQAVKALESRLGLIGWGQPCEVVYDRVRVQYGPVMLDKDGLPPPPAKFRRHLQTAARNATIKVNGVERAVGAVRVHDLRHTYASRLVQGGIDIQTVSEAIGHSSLKTTERYAKVANSRWDDMRKVLSSPKGKGSTDD